MTIYDEHERLPKALLERLAIEQGAMLRLWVEVNPDE
jgi:hypothetical protein